MTIGNIGVGLFILLILWIGALVIFVIGVKLQSNISWIVLVSATLFTVILLLIPTSSNIQQEVVSVRKNGNCLYNKLLCELF